MSKKKVNKKTVITAEPGNVPHLTGKNLVMEDTIAPLVDLSKVKVENVVVADFTPKEEPKAEKTIENEILDLLNRERNCFAFKVNTQGVYDAAAGSYRSLSKFVLPGTSDIICCISGKFVAIEVKTQKGVLSQAQAAFLIRVRKSGGAAITARSAEEALKNIQHFDRTGVCVIT
jgi:hypothetical protein